MKRYIRSNTSAKKWVDYLDQDVRDRLGGCYCRKSDVPILVNARWQWLKDTGKAAQGFTREDALVYVLELLDCNGQDRLADVTEEEYNMLKADASSSVNGQAVTAAYDFSEPIDTEIQSGLFWDVDGHRIEILERVGSLRAKVRESWIAEDTGEEREYISMYDIGVDNKGNVRSEYIYDPKYPDYKMYAGAAFNYPYDEEWDRKQQWKQTSEEWQRRAREEYDDDDDYTPSATRGDYSPSHPWDAPGMSIKDFF